jgi:CubicO group peptidase (beta-lactamase class C family)
MQLLGLVLEHVTGQPLDLALVGGLLRPLSLLDTGFRPANRLTPADLATRVVATEAKKGRGLIRGVVHDENAYALGGVAGHAGLFATALDVAAVGQLLLDRGEYGMTRVLPAGTVDRMMVDLNAGLPVRDPENRPGRGAHGLGVELNQQWYMGRLAGPRTFGHTGFTGTSLVVDPTRRLVAVFLTNRVHPDRAWGSVNAARVAVANVLADGIAPRYA